MIRQWVQDALDFSGLSQAALARRLKKEFRISVDRAAVNKIVSGKRQLSADEMVAIASITRFPVSDFDDIPLPMTPIVGYAAAGSDQVQFGDGQGPFGEVKAPSWANKKTVAVIIRGTSLGRLLDGWVAFYDDRRDPPDESLIGEVCICGLDDNRVMIKKLRPGSGPGLYHLESAIEDTIFDARVIWAAKVRELRPR